MQERAAAPKLRQPPALFLLFGAEMWERFSFYGMRALLVLFAADTAAHGGLGWSKEAADHLLGWYGLAAYAMPLIGGYAADRLIGTHRSVVLGGAIIAAGHFCMAIPAVPTFFVGLALVATGTGFFKPNVSTMVGQLYQQGDGRRDAGFTIFYMGVNVGGLLGPLVCGYLAESPRWGWHYGFGAAGVGMVLGIALYAALRSRYLAGIGLPPERGVGAATDEASAATRLTREQRDCLIALLVIIAFSIPFWMAYEQTGSSMNFFAAERTDRVILGHSFPASWFQSVNPAVLLLTAPVFAVMWTALARRGREPSTPAKMAAAMLLLGLGFVVMVVGARRGDGGGGSGGSGGLVSPLWLVGAYSFHTFGELWLSPIGLSTVTKLSPPRLASRMMALWFFATAIAELLAGQLAAFTDRVERGQLFHVLGGQADFYLFFVVTSVVSGVALFAFIRPFKRLSHGRDV